MGILDYFDRLAIIHLPDRDDRLRALTKELARIGVDIDSPKVTIPDPPMPETSNGFTSRGVYGSFLSHVEIIENAYRDGLDTVWVLEDDAIFSRRFRNQQQRIASHLRDHKWDLCFLDTQSITVSRILPQAFSASPARLSGRTVMRSTGGSCRD
jgi:glycosyl transferase family 25